MEILAKNAGAIVLAISILYAANQHNETQRCITMYGAVGIKGMVVWEGAGLTPRRVRRITVAAKRIGCRDGWIVRLGRK